MRVAADIIGQLDLSPAHAAQPFHLKVGHVGVTVLCPGPLRTALIAYFAEALSDTPGAIKVELLPNQFIDPEPNWVEWQREPGKAGRKDAIWDLDDARLIRKVRSGVTFLQAPDRAIAWGPLEENESTVINFINTQVLNSCLRDGWQLCHAAAVTCGARTLAISGLSGGGKSTSVLRMMDLEAARFVSNDRVLVRPGTPVRVLGIPKHPRINPGTILGNPRLQGMLSQENRGELAAMAPSDLWGLEQKHDLIISDIYGPNRVCYDGQLTDFWVLNWTHESTTPTSVTEVSLSDRPDLLGAIMKSPGPFYQHPDGRFEPNGNSPKPAGYLRALRDVRICEVSGRIDFDILAQNGKALLDG